MRFIRPVTNIVRKPDADSMTISQGLYGEHVDVLVKHADKNSDKQTDMWHIRNRRDGYEGFVPASSLGRQRSQSTHCVATAATLMFSQPNIKSPSPLRLLFGSELVVRGSYDEQFNITDSGLYVARDHCLPLVNGRLSGEGSSLARDLVAVAEALFLGVPYLWGGRSIDGFDCSGLVQMSAFAMGVLLPRDSIDQQAFLTCDVQNKERRRCDIVFWPGHVGLMINERELLHATAHSMLSIVEPLTDVTARTEMASAIKRL